MKHRAFRRQPAGGRGEAGGEDPRRSDHRQLLPSARDDADGQRIAGIISDRGIMDAIADHGTEVLG